MFLRNISAEREGVTHVRPRERTPLRTEGQPRMGRGAGLEHQAGREGPVLVGIVRVDYGQDTGRPVRE